MKKISIVVPCYNEEESIPLYYEAMNKIVDKMKDKATFEFIYINDGSKDKTLEILRRLAKKDKKVRYISMSRNFGKEPGMYAGLKASTGDYVTTMDVDLQDPPELLEEMFDTLEKSDEYDCVAAKSTSRVGYSFLRKTFTKWFYAIIDKLSIVEMVPGARDYRLMTRQMVDAVLEMAEYNRYSKGIYSFVGFNTKWIEYENQERVAGTTKWNFWKLFYYALDGIVGYSTKLLLWPAFIGAFLVFVSFVLLVVIIVKLIMNDPLTLLLVLSTIMTFLSGIILGFMGIIGEYLAMTYTEVKNRPIYIVKETEKDLKRDK